MTKRNGDFAPETGLDPKDWNDVRKLGHQMVDEMVSYLATIGERPVWKPVPPAVKAQFQSAAPRTAQGADAVYEDFKKNVLPYPIGNIHPRFWSWVCGAGTAGGMLAEMLSAGMNSLAHGGDQSAIYMEEQVLSWLKEILGYPATASGILVSGGSMANFVAMAVARNATAPWDVKSEGVFHEKASRRIFYCSSETHSSVQKAVEALGMGSKSLRYIGVNEKFEIKMDELRDAVAADRSAGRMPVCVVGNAGTVNTGAIDDLNALADFCKSERLWFHVDGAFGATAAISPALSPLVRGMERADSVAFDLHKWMQMQYEVGCVLIRSTEHHHNAFSYQASYLNSHERGLAAGPKWFSHYGLELSRSSRALKVWFSMKEHGVDAFRKLVEQNVSQAKYLGELIARDERLELLAPISLNIVCFRFKGELTNEHDLEAVNKEILQRLQERGIAAPSTTVIRGKFVIRVANVNHRSRRPDFEELAIQVLKIGEEVVAEIKAGRATQMVAK